MTGHRRGGPDRRRGREGGSQTARPTMMPTPAARSVSDIVRCNVFTAINAILGGCCVIVLFQPDR